MAEEGFKRKLAAILSADVEGYSRLMDDNEEATVRTLTSYRSAITDLVQQYRGRIIDTPGDNILADFTSVVDAVNCAVEIQRELAERNAELADNRKMQFRIGVNLGDVIDEDGRIYGDGVNIAARVESLAEAGGICISGRAHDQVENKLGLEYEDLGMHEVKNISRPIQVHRVLSYSGAAAHRVVQAKETLGRKWHKISISAAVVVVIAVGLGIWLFYMRRPTMEPASVENMSFPLPDKPSIAVLAFDNLSGDPEQEHFSDGIAENIITALSKAGELFVIARNSSFTYKGKPVKVQQVSQELGVRYVLEGSVQKSGDRVRITAQLIDAIKGQHLWAEKYDRHLKDIFEIQDEITMKIVTALRVKLTTGEEARIYAKQFKNLDAYLKYIQATSIWNKGTKESLMQYGKLAQEIIDTEPESPGGYRLRAWYHFGLAGRGISFQENIQEAVKLAQKAVSMDEFDSTSHITLGYFYNLLKKNEKAITEAKRSLELEPNSAFAHSLYGAILNYVGRFDEALAHLKQAIRLNPFPPYYYYFHLGTCYNHKGQYEDALTEFKKALQLAPNAAAVHANIAATYILLDREEEAHASAAKALELDPTLSLSAVSKRSRYKDPAYFKFILDAMRKAGIPE